MCFRLHEILKLGRSIGNIFYFVKSLHGEDGETTIRLNREIPRKSPKMLIIFLCRVQNNRHIWVP